MAKKIKFKRNHAGVGQLLKSQKMMDCVRSYGEKVASQCDGNYNVECGIINKKGDRASAHVVTADDETRRKVYEDNALLKGLH